jgi:hypothetical protein
MAALRLYAIGIDEVRDLVGASPATAERARAEAADLFAVTAARAPRGGLLTRLFGGNRRAPEPIDPAQPTADDLETVLSGRFATPERARACWQVLEYLVVRRAWGHHEMDLDERGLADFDFAVARAGGTADTGLAHVVGSDARIGLSPVPELRVGYVPYTRVRSAAAALARLEVGGEHAAAIDALREFLGKYAGWASEAIESEWPVPDLLAFHEVV